tara:strand:+ start:4218 stop:4997 length:780 start_codon:yes stop_codon:yes gene_type:complete
MMRVTKKTPDQLHLFHIPYAILLASLMFLVPGVIGIYYTLQHYTIHCTKNPHTTTAHCQLKGTLLGHAVHEQSIAHVRSLRLDRQMDQEDNTFTYALGFVTRKKFVTYPATYHLDKAPKELTIQRFQKWLREGKGVFTFYNAPEPLGYFLYFFVVGGVAMLFLARFIRLTMDHRQNKCTLTSWGLTGRQSQQFALHAIEQATLQSTNDSEHDTYHVVLQLKDRTVPLINYSSTRTQSQEKLVESINDFIMSPLHLSPKS